MFSVTSLSEVYKYLKGNLIAILFSRITTPDRPYLRSCLSGIGLPEGFKKGITIIERIILTKKIILFS